MYPAMVVRQLGPKMGWKASSNVGIFTGLCCQNRCPPATLFLRAQANDIRYTVLVPERSPHAKTV